MDDIISIFVCYFVLRALGVILKDLFGGEHNNDYRRDR